MTDASSAIASITPKKRQQIHQSFMRMVGVCQLQAMYRYKLGIRRPPSAYLHVGTAVDKSITADLQHKIDHQELMKRSDVIDLAASTFEERDAAEPFELDADDKDKGREQVKSENKDKTVDLAGLHYDKAAPVIQPSHVARSFSINMDTWLRKRAKQLHNEGDGEADLEAAKILHSEAAAMNSAARIGIDFAGEIDVQEQLTAVNENLWKGAIPAGITVRDSKTSGKSPSSDSAEDSAQLVGYSLATLVMDGMLPQVVALDYLVRTPKKHDLKYVPRETTVDMTDINMFLFRFARAVHSWHVACKTGSFLPANPDDWHCSLRFCGYADRCPAFKRPKTVTVPNLVQIQGQGA